MPQTRPLSHILHTGLIKEPTVSSQKRFVSAVLKPGELCIQSPRSKHPLDPTRVFEVALVKTQVTGGRLALKNLECLWPLASADIHYCLAQGDAAQDSNKQHRETELRVEKA